MFYLEQVAEGISFLIIILKIYYLLLLLLSTCGTLTLLLGKVLTLA